MVKVEFSKNGEGKVFLISNKKSIKMIECKNQNIKIGEHGTNEDEGEILVQLDFNKIESIDILIKHLLHIRENLESEEQLILGC